jgi:glucose-fructose oxidoreductase
MATTRTPSRQMRSKHVRYAVVGLGHIAQVAVLPAFAHARRNSQLVGVVSGDATKRRRIAKRYDVVAYDYDDYEACLDEVDAVYIALPNSMHADYTVRAAAAGVHVLCEKPMAVTAEECERMIEACRSGGVKLMIAYRLHFDELNVGVIDLVRRGRIGEPRLFSSSFSMRVREGNIRTQDEMGGGTLYDIGVYCINAARYLFRDEPTDVVALSVHSGARHLAEIDESTGAVLRFGGGRIATFVTSFNAADVASYRLVGTKGNVRVDPAFEYAEGLACEITVNGRTTRKRIPQRDQFAPELLYFSRCILEGLEPEPSGTEGLQDVRVVQALYESANTGKSVSLPPYADQRYPSTRQVIARPAVRKPVLVHARSASRS